MHDKDNEILNLDYHIRRLVLKALNIFEKRSKVAEKLGISERHLYNHMNNYSIVKENGVWISKTKITL